MSVHVYPFDYYLGQEVKPASTWNLQNYFGVFVFVFFFNPPVEDCSWLSKAREY